MDSFLDAEKNDIIELKNEQGDVVEFSLVDTIELNDKKYFLLTPENEDDESLDYGCIYIFQLEVKGKTEILKMIVDEKTMDKVYDEYERIAGVELGVYADEYEDEEEIEN